MKKTITMLLALAGMAGATEITDLTYTSGTIVAQMNVEAMKEIAGDGFGGAGDAIVLFAFTGTWQNANAAALGIVNNGSSTSHVTGIYNYWIKDTTEQKAQDFKPTMSNMFNSSTPWDRISDLSIAYSWTTTDSNTTDIYAAIGYTTDAGVKIMGSSLIDQMKFSSVPFTMTATSLTVNDTYVKSFTYSNEAITSVDGVKALVPEPATATLSLLALAGLAARRRRH